MVPNDDTDTSSLRTSRDHDLPHGLIGRLAQALGVTRETVRAYIKRQGHDTAVIVALQIIDEDEARDLEIVRAGYRRVRSRVVLALAKKFRPRTDDDQFDHDMLREAEDA